MRRTSLLAKATPFRHSLHSAVRVRVTLSLSLLSRRYDFEEFPDQEISIWKYFQLFSLFFMTTSFEENEFQFFSVRLALGRGRERIFKFRVSHVFIFFSSLFFYSSSEGNKLHFLLCVLFPHPLEREEGRRKKKAKCCLSTWQSRNVQLSGTDACTRETREVKKKKGLEKKIKPEEARNLRWRRSPYTQI